MVLGNHLCFMSFLLAYHQIALLEGPSKIESIEVLVGVEYLVVLQTENSSLER
jgi:hypothetical protein